jgi:hypothetical protein
MNCLIDRLIAPIKINYPYFCIVKPLCAVIGCNKTRIGTFPGGGQVNRLYKTGYPDEKNTSFNTQIIHKAFRSHLPDRDVCIIDAVFV